MPCLARRPAKVNEILSMFQDFGHTYYTHRLIYTVETPNYETKIYVTDTSVMSQVSNHGRFYNWHVYTNERSYEQKWMSYLYNTSWINSKQYVLASLKQLILPFEVNVISVLYLCMNVRASFSTATETALAVWQTPFAWNYLHYHCLQEVWDF